MLLVVLVVDELTSQLAQQYVVRTANGSSASKADAIKVACSREMVLCSRED